MELMRRKEVTRLKDQKSNYDEVEEATMALGSMSAYLWRDFLGENKANIVIVHEHFLPNNDSEASKAMPLLENILTLEFC